MGNSDKLVLGYSLSKRFLLFCMTIPLVYFGSINIYSAALDYQIFGWGLLLIGLGIAGLNSRLVFDKHAKMVTKTFFILFPVKKEKQTILTAKSVLIREINLLRNNHEGKHGLFPVIIQCSDDDDVFIKTPRSYIKARNLAKQIAVFLSLPLDDENINQVRQAQELDRSFLLLKKNRREKPALPEPYEFTTISRQSEEGTTCYFLPFQGQYNPILIGFNLFLSTILSLIFLEIQNHFGLYDTDISLWIKLIDMIAIPIIYIIVFTFVAPLKWEYRLLKLDNHFLSYISWSWLTRKTKKIPLKELQDLTINNLDVVAASDKAYFVIDGLGSIEDATFIVEDIYYRMNKMIL